LAEEGRGGEQTEPSPVPFGSSAGTANAFPAPRFVFPNTFRQAKRVARNNHPANAVFLGNLLALYAKAKNTARVTSIARTSSPTCRTAAE